LPERTIAVSRAHDGGEIFLRQSGCADNVRHPPARPPGPVPRWCSETKSRRRVSVAEGGPDVARDGTPFGAAPPIRRRRWPGRAERQSIGRPKYRG
jgi:hypothetical protein